LKRLAVWLLQVLSEALLFGCLLGALVSSQIGLLYGVIGSALAVPVVLFLHGYYLTRALAGLVWRSQKPWLYPAIAATLFVTHIHIAIVRSRSDLTPEARAMELPFLAGGASIVLLARWLAAGFCGSGDIGSGQSYRWQFEFRRRLKHRRDRRPPTRRLRGTLLPHRVSPHFDAVRVISVCKTQPWSPKQLHSASILAFMNLPVCH
jgi:hypothetical protein